MLIKLMLKQNLGCLHFLISKKKDVTPYMHCFAMYTCEFVRLYGNIVTFTQQDQMEAYILYYITVWTSVCKKDQVIPVHFSSCKV